MSMLQITPYEAFKKEFKFALNIRITKKPIDVTEEMDSRKSATSSDSKLKKSDPNFKSESLPYINNI